MNLLIAETLSQNKLCTNMSHTTEVVAIFVRFFVYLGENFVATTTSFGPLQSEISSVDDGPLKPYHRTKKFANNSYTSVSLTIFEIFDVKRIFP